jgi:DNA polymerase III subunit alpha
MATTANGAAELWRSAEPLEGLTRNVGMHAGGVLIAPGKLTDFCPLYHRRRRRRDAVSQFDKDDVEAVGLVKFDFLGLRTSPSSTGGEVRRALRARSFRSGGTAARRSGGLPDVLKDANTTAMFQVESRGMKKLLKKLGPDRFEDIIALLALYRPGPLGSGMVDDFIARKQGSRRSTTSIRPRAGAWNRPTASSCTRSR